MRPFTMASVAGVAKVLSSGRRLDEEAAAARRNAQMLETLNKCRSGKDRADG